MGCVFRGIKKQYVILFQEKIGKIIIQLLQFLLQQNGSEKNSSFAPKFLAVFTNENQFFSYFLENTIFTQYKCCYGTIVTSVFVLKIFNGIPYVIYFHSEILDSSFFSPFPKSVSNFATFKLLVNNSRKKKERKKTFEKIEEKIASVPILV